MTYNKLLAPVVDVDDLLGQLGVGEVVLLLLEHLPDQGPLEVPTPGLHNKIPAYKILARGWVAQESFCS